MKFLCYCVVLLLSVELVASHGHLMDPPGRGSVWRWGYKVRRNYNDNGLNCGGYQTQWLVNGGRCGHCGDPYNGVRQHEQGGKYASGIIARTYMSGQVIDVIIQLTANHGGWFEFYLCPQSRLSKTCFERHPLQMRSGGYRHKLTNRRAPAKEHVAVQLPADVTCKHCVLQWRWNCGQSYGKDSTRGTYCPGCGKQEQFWNCADISIGASVATNNLRDYFKKYAKNLTSNSVSLTSQRNNITVIMNNIPKYSSFNSFRKVKQSVLVPKYSSFNSFRKGKQSVLVPKLNKNTEKKCGGSRTYGRMLDSWCAVNCHRGYCPFTHCKCT